MQPTAPTPTDTWSHYQSPQALHDEAFQRDGQVRPHWRYLLESLAKLGPDALSERERKLRRVLRDDGATYNDYNRIGQPRQWELDPIPLMLGSEEWASVEAGVRERAELFNLMLRDLYGDRQLIRHGLLPPELVYGHSGFIRPCQGLFLPGDHQLIQYAADIIRAPDGAIRVVADRSQAPSGTGYALENRTVMSRVFPSLFRDSHVHLLSLYFQRLRAKLGELSPGSGVPRIVILSPGAYNETYFEHVHLANYLGFSLVQGNDLTVRDGYVWMKALDGLQRVDVILRRVDDHYCDPVELKPDSQLGIPGLLDVVRAGRVSVANPLGSGVLENPALIRYLPDIAQFFLGREPRLSSLTTYWCGDPADREFVLANLGTLVLKPTSRSVALRSVYGAELGPEELAQWRARIEARPLQFAAQEYLPPSSLPVWADREFQPRTIILRSFAVASGTSYAVMPGGLTRVGKADGTALISNRLGSISKDTWVLASEPEKRPEGESSRFSGVESQPGERLGLPSRVVENLFWLGRYAERSESALRLLRTVFVQLHGVEPLPPVTYALLLRATTHVTTTYPGFLGGDDELLRNPTPELLSLVTDQQRPGSVANSLNALLTAAEEIKEALSADTQRIINDLRDQLTILEGQLRANMNSAPEETLDPLVTSLLALSGLARESMMHGLGWHFLEMGRRLERAWQTASLVRSLLAPVVSGEDERTLLEAVLLSMEALISYRRRYYGRMNVANGLELLLFEPDNPRSLLYQLEELDYHMAQLPRDLDQRGLPAFRRMALEASTALNLSDAWALDRRDEGAEIRYALDGTLALIQQRLADAAKAIAERFFDQSGGPHPLSLDQGEAWL